MTEELAQQDADEACRKLNGAALAMINSQIEYNALKSFLNNAIDNYNWIGLMCNGTTTASCYWAHDRGTAEDYYFKTGSTDPKTGECVYFDKSNGKLASMACSYNTQFVCELPPTTTDSCSNNYNRNCYSVVQNSANYTDAQATCEETCGNLVSIHSELENRYVLSLFSSTGIVSLGGMAASKNYIVWNDFSVQLYNKIGEFEDGGCLFMNVGGDNIGVWHFDVCSRKTWFVCKRPTGLKCES
ncbi:unnamed protein product [Caenorhabditis brenneri]